MDQAVASICFAIVRGLVTMVAAVIILALVDTVLPGVDRLQGPVGMIAFLGGAFWPVIAPVIAKQMR